MFFISHICANYLVIPNITPNDVDKYKKARDVESWFGCNFIGKYDFLNGGAFTAKMHLRGMNCDIVPVAVFPDDGAEMSGRNPEGHFQYL